MIGHSVIVNMADYFNLLIPLKVKQFANDYAM